MTSRTLDTCINIVEQNSVYGNIKYIFIAQYKSLNIIVLTFLDTSCHKRGALNYNHTIFYIINFPKTENDVELAAKQLVMGCLPVSSSDLIEIEAKQNSPTAYETCFRPKNCVIKVSVITKIHAINGDELIRKFSESSLILIYGYKLSKTPKK